MIKAAVSAAAARFNILCLLVLGRAGRSVAVRRVWVYGVGTRQVQTRPPPKIGAMGPKEKQPTNWRAWIGALLIVLVVVCCLQNSQKVSVEVLFASFDAPLIVVLSVFTLVGMLIGYIGPVYRRHRREEKRAGQELEKK